MLYVQAHRNADAIRNVRIKADKGLDIDNDSPLGWMHLMADAAIKRAFDVD